MKCDLPVHCLQSQVLGEWIFEISEVREKAGILNNPCGHQFPDNEETSYLAMKDTFLPNKTITVSLNLDSTVVYNHDDPFFKDNGFKLKQPNSTFWTMIYDEGFEIRINDHRFFTFSEYFKNPSPKNKSDQYLSNCAKTLVGWYKKENSNLLACVRGHKSNDVDIINHQEEKLWVVEGEVTVLNAETFNQHEFDKPEQAQKDNFIRQLGASISDFVNEIKNDIVDIIDDAKLSVLHIIENNFVKPQQQIDSNEAKQVQNNSTKQSANLKLPSQNTQSMFRLKENNKLSIQKMDTNFKMHSMMAKKINKLHSEGKIKWKAQAYDMFKDMTLGEINLFSGIKRSSIKSTNKQGQDVSDLEKQLTLEQFIKPAISQKKCGSCYAVTTLAMYQARLKFKYNMDVTLSVQHVLDCSFYNQGCNGGFEYLVGKFAHEHYMFEDNCKPYNGQKQYDCRQLRCNPENVNRVFRVDEYYNIGQKFGGCSEREMMLEMKKNGPIAVSFEPDYLFSMYKSGIYSFGNNNDYILKGLPKPEWTKVDHAVLCYGWGEDDDGTKYWLLQNSWGKNWGENGNFRMLRGVDSGGIEAMCEAGHVSVINLHDNPDIKQEIKTLYKRS